MRVGLIGGTGLEDRLVSSGLVSVSERVTPDTPFGRASSPVSLGRVGEVPVAFVQRHGPKHLIPPHHVPHRANIFSLKLVGVTHILATGAVGSLREEIRPGELVICDQLIDRTDGRERTFFDHAAVHAEFADPFCPVMRKWLIGAAGRVEVKTHARGTYVTMEGPSFSTRAESNMHRLLGADVVGMTALPEARLAREAEIAYALIALATDYDCWRPHPADAPAESLLAEIIGNLTKATDAAIRLVGAALADAGALRAPSPAHEALKLGIFTHKEHIDRAEVERLRPLWGRYFS